MKNHYTHKYLLNPVHKVTVELVGIGGTGSQVLAGLARINKALMLLDHPGLHVRAWDADRVTVNNMGRQLFSPADVGVHKATVSIQRVNRFFGTEWEAIPTKYNPKMSGNILITCVDTAKARVEISKKLNWKNRVEPVDNLYYWLDLGNLQKTGQCVIGTGRSSIPPSTDKSAKRTLKTVVQKFPQLRKIKETDQGPSCSLAEALEKQDLFINSTLAQFGCNLLWKLFREGMIKHHGCYVNLDSLSVNPMKIK